MPNISPTFASRGWLAVSGCLAAVFALSLGAQAQAGACQGLDYVGKCHGDVVRWCENGRLHAVDCAPKGLRCGYNESGGYFDCIPHDVDDDCDDELDYAGACEGGAVVWCEGGAPRTLACKEGTECAWHPNGYFDCLPEGFTDASSPPPMFEAAEAGESPDGAPEAAAEDADGAWGAANVHADDETLLDELPAVSAGSDPAPTDGAEAPGSGESSREGPAAAGCRGGTRGSAGLGALWMGLWWMRARRRSQP